MTNRWDKEKIRKQLMSEAEFEKFAKTEHAAYQKQVNHLDDYIPYYEYYLELSAVYERKTK